MRAFVALPLPETALDALERMQEELRTGRHVPRENMHLTLAFLDNQPEQRLLLLHEELKEIKAPPLQLQLAGADVFGTKKPRVLFASVAADPGLRQLRDQVRRAARNAGIILPRERFRPHVTLARFARQLELGGDGKIAEFLQLHGGTAGGNAGQGFTVDRFALFLSTLAPDGAHYDILAEYPLL